MKRLAALDDSGCLLTPADSRLLVVTGQSSFRTSALGRDQLGFLETVAPKEATVLRAGFPFHSAFMQDEFRETGILEASWRNTCQVLWTMNDGLFRHVITRRLQAALDRTSERLMLIAGSCGLQMVNSCWPRLSVREGLRVDVIALGPACFGSLRRPCTVVQAAQDRWSQLFYAGPVHYRCQGGHLDYWASDEVRHKVRELLR